MARTTRMSLIELMIMKDDIRDVLQYLGKKGNFQFQSGFDSDKNSSSANPYRDVFEKFKTALVYFGYDEKLNLENSSYPSDEERSEANKRTI